MSAQLVQTGPRRKANALRRSFVGVVALVTLSAFSFPHAAHAREVVKQECEDHNACSSHESPTDTGHQRCDHSADSCLTMSGCLATAPATLVAVGIVAGGPVVTTRIRVRHPGALDRLVPGPLPPPPIS